MAPGYRKKRKIADYKALREFMSLPAKNISTVLRMFEGTNFTKTGFFYFASLLPSGNNSSRYLNIENLAGIVCPLFLAVIIRDSH
jgi:hypothetical protein